MITRPESPVYLGAIDEGDRACISSPDVHP